MSAKGPTRATCDTVDERDGWACVRCGRSLHVSSGSRHHRQLRRHGDHSAANLVLLCGSGTTGCHGWAHAHPDRARKVGLIVRGWHDPAVVPVLTISGWRRLAVDGSVESVTDDAARDIMEELGLQ